jgi:hypothetical protein
MASRKSSHLLAASLALVVVVGCGPQDHIVHPSPTTPSADPVPRSAPVSEGVVSELRWSLPTDAKFIAFLGTRMLTTRSDKQTLDATDASGKVIWSRQLGSEVDGVVLRSDLSEALVRTTTGYHWLDLDSGQTLGEPPISEPVIGDMFWYEEWLLVGLPVHKGPVDPKAPGKSFSHMEWTLFRSRREQRGWDRIGVLVDQGGYLASLSRDGKRALIESQSTGDYELFEGGSRLTGLKLGTANAMMLLTASGNYVVKRFPNGATIYSTEGQVVAELSAPGNQFAVWGDRAVLTDGDTFVVFDHSGRELFRQRGSVPREQSNPNFLLVTGSESRLLDAKGKPIMQFGTPAPQMTPNGCWVYERDDQGLLAYALSGCD